MLLRRFRLGLLVLSVLLASFPLHSAADFSAEWSKCVSTIQGQYYASQSKRAQLDGLVAQYREPAVTAETRADFVRIVNEMIAKLGDSHFQAFGPDDQGFYLMQGVLYRKPVPVPGIGAFFSRQKTGWRVDMVYTGSSAEKAGLRVGDILLKADGKPFEPVSSMRAAQGTASVDCLRGGEVLQKTIEVKSGDLIAQAWAATLQSVKVIEQNGKKIGYIRLWMMLDDRFRSALTDAATNTFKDTDGVIVDLRDGFGGSAEGFADVFFRPSVLIERKGLQSNTVTRYGYSKPVVMLTNGGTRSAKESFSYMMKATKRATLIGSRTAGKLLGAVPVQIADWLMLEVPVVNVLLDGKRLEGVGVAPDIEVKTEFGPNGEDLVIREALKFLATGSKAE